MLHRVWLSDNAAKHCNKATLRVYVGIVKCTTLIVWVEYGMMMTKFSDRARFQCHPS